MCVCVYTIDTKIKVRLFIPTLFSQSNAPFYDLLDFSAIFAPNFVKFDPWVWHNKRSNNMFSSFFPGRILGLSYAPLKFSKEKKSLLWLLLLNPLMEFLKCK